MRQALHNGSSRSGTGIASRRARLLGIPARRAVSRTAVKPAAYLDEKRPTATRAPVVQNQLDALKAMSVVVADTGEPGLVKLYKPVDCTTNPSLVFKAVQGAENEHYLRTALKEEASQRLHRDAVRPFAGVADILAVNIGAELLTIVPGKVSTEVDAHLSYDTQATVDKALKLVDMYAKKDVSSDRLYIKIASTWEGIRACEILQKQNIDCNMTLLFSFAQAAACADAGAALISPFVGRILDWYKAKEGRDFPAHEDPGVLSVNRIYNYYKVHGYPTVVMAASFRNIGEVRELAGCDKITIAPSLLAELEASQEPLERKLSPEIAVCKEDKISGFNNKLFYELHNADQMAVDKLKQGIDSFASDQRKLEELLAKLASA